MLYLFIFQNLSFFIRKYHKLLLQIIIQFIPICSKILYKRRLYKIFLHFRKIWQILQEKHDKMLLVKAKDKSINRLKKSILQI